MTDPGTDGTVTDGTTVDDTTAVDATDVPVVSDADVESLMGVLTGLIASASTPEIQQAQTLLVQRLALEGSVIPSRIPAPANITQVGGYINLLTALGQDDMRTQLLSAALGLAGTLPLPGLPVAAPALALTPVANDRPAGSVAVPLTVSLRSDLASGLSAALDAAHAAGGLLPLWSPPALPPAGTPVLLDLLLYLGRAVLVAPTATLADPQTDAVILGRAASDPGTAYRLAVRVSAGAPGGNTEDWTCLARDPVGAAFVEQVVTGATMLPVEIVLAGTGLTAVQLPGLPAGLGDLSWARLAALGGLIPAVTRLGDELALVYSAAAISSSALATMTSWLWDGTRFAPPAVT
jgi:hypothetical protein